MKISFTVHTQDLYINVQKLDDTISTQIALPNFWKSLKLCWHLRDIHTLQKSTIVLSIVEIFLQYSTLSWEDV